MAYVVVNVTTNEVVGTYASERGARIAMRLMNKKAGFTRHCVCYINQMTLEWSTGSDNKSQYAPFQVKYKI